MTIQYLSISFPDGFFCKDNRGWYTGNSNKGNSLDWPLPSTLRGALRTAAGYERGSVPQTPEDWERETSDVVIQTVLSFRTKLTASASQSDIVWPRPKDAIALEVSLDEKQKLTEVQLSKLRPQKPQNHISCVGKHSSQSAIEKLQRVYHSIKSAAKPKPLPVWWTNKDFTDWLKDASITYEKLSQTQAPPKRTDMHVVIDPDTRAAADGKLFSKETVETITQEKTKETYVWSMAVALENKNAWTPNTIAVGGMRKLAYCSALSKALFEAPEIYKESSQGLRLIFVTPAIFQGGWLPDGFVEKEGIFCGTLAALSSVELVLRAAIVDRPQPISGYDQARGKYKTISLAVPAGSVYFLEKRSGQPFSKDELKSLWLGKLGAQQESGMGAFVAGYWTPSK
jgi:CRISPR-associated protein Cmr3